MWRISGGWSSLDWWRISFGGCRSIRWRWAAMKGAGRLDSTPAVTVTMRYAAKQAGFNTLCLFNTVWKPASDWCFDISGISYQELDERLENDPNIVVCWKWREVKNKISDWKDRQIPSTKDGCFKRTKTLSIVFIVLGLLLLFFKHILSHKDFHIFLLWFSLGDFYWNCKKKKKKECLCN